MLSSLQSDGHQVDHSLQLPKMFDHPSTVFEIQLETRSPSQLQHHVDGSSGANIVRFQRPIICQLLSRVNQSNLVHLDTLLFLQGLLDGEDLILGLEIHGLLAPGQSFDKDLVSDLEIISAATKFIWLAS